MGNFPAVRGTGCEEVWDGRREERKERPPQGGAAPMGAADNVAAIQNHRNRMLLHGSHLVEVHIFETVENFIFQIEFIETHKTEIFNS